MKKTKIIYWTTTGLFSVMMLFSAFAYFTNPEVAANFTKIGFPNYFRIELGIAKFIGAIVLLVPQVPNRIKEWAYAGFGITLISAAITHAAIGDQPGMAMPLIFLGILIISNRYLHKQVPAATAWTV